MRCSLAISSFRCSTSVSRESSCSRVVVSCSCVQSRRSCCVRISAWCPRFAPRLFGAQTWATLPSASGLGRRRRGFPLLRVLASWTLITFGTLHTQAAGLHFSHGLHYHQNQIPLHAMRADRGEVPMRKVLLLVPKSD